MLVTLIALAAARVGVTMPADTPVGMAMRMGENNCQGFLDTETLSKNDSFLDQDTKAIRLPSNPDQQLCLAYPIARLFVLVA